MHRCGCNALSATRRQGSRPRGYAAASMRENAQSSGIEITFGAPYKLRVDQTTISSTNRGNPLGYARIGPRGSLDSELTGISLRCLGRRLLNPLESTAAARAAVRARPCWHVHLVLSTRFPRSHTPAAAGQPAHQAQRSAPQPSSRQARSRTAETRKFQTLEAPSTAPQRSPRRRACMQPCSRSTQRSPVRSSCSVASALRLLLHATQLSQ